MTASGDGGFVTLNGRQLALEQADLAAFLGQLGYGAERPGLAVAVNGQVVSRARWRGHRLRAGDEIEVVGATQGG